MNNKTINSYENSLNEQIEVIQEEQEISDLIELQVEEAKENKNGKI